MTNLFQNLLKNPLKLLIAFAWVAFVVFSINFMISRELKIVDLVEILKTYFIQFSQNGMVLWMPIIFILVFTLRPLFLIPTWVMNILAYFLFGPFLGYFWVVVSEIISATVLFLVIKYLVGENLKHSILKTAKKFGIDLSCKENKIIAYSRSFENKILSKTGTTHLRKQLDYIKSRLSAKFTSVNKDFYTTLVLRLASLPFDFVTGLCAISGISLKKFAAGTFLVSLVWVGLFFLTFDSLVSGLYLNSLVNMVIFSVFIIISITLAKKSGLIGFSKNTQKYV